MFSLFKKNNNIGEVVQNGDNLEPSIKLEKQLAEQIHFNASH